MAEVVGEMVQVEALCCPALLLVVELAKMVPMWLVHFGGSGGGGWFILSRWRWRRWWWEGCLARGAKGGRSFGVAGGRTGRSPGAYKALDVEDPMGGGDMWVAVVSATNVDRDDVLASGRGRPGVAVVGPEVEVIGGLLCKLVVRGVGG